MGMGTEWGQDEDEDTDGDRMVTLYLERDEVWGQEGFAPRCAGLEADVPCSACACPHHVPRAWWPRRCRVSPLGPCRCRVPPWGHAGVTLAGRAEGGELGRHVPCCATLCRAKLRRATLCRTAPCRAARQEARTAGAPVPAHF